MAPNEVHLLHCLLERTLLAQAAGYSDKAILACKRPENARGRSEGDLDFPYVRKVRIPAWAETFEELIVVLDMIAGHVALESRPDVREVIPLAGR